MFIQELACVNLLSPCLFALFAPSHVFLPACLTVQLLKPGDCWDLADESYTDIYGSSGKTTSAK